MNVLLSALLLSFAFFLPSLAYGEGWPSYRTVIHAHTDVSSGKYDFDELIGVAQGYGIDAVFLTDNHWLGFQYGLPRLEQIAWVSKELPSILNYGPRRYLREIAEANDRQGAVLLIPGMEVIPRYYWEGSPLKGDLTHWNMQRNLMVLGVDDPDFITDLPVSAGYVSGRDTVEKFMSRALVIWLVVAMSLLAWLPKAGAYWAGHSRHKARGQFMLMVLFPSALALMMFNLLQRGKTNDIYGQTVGVDAEQRVIDAAAHKHYFTYWAHPEASDDNRFGPIAIRTNPYPDMLRRTRNYNAFGALYEQGNTLYLAGEAWDQVLLDYIQGVRGFPAWALGEMLYHFEGQAGKKLENVETLIWANEKTQQALLHSLKYGRFYSRRRSAGNALVLNEFSINNSDSDASWVNHIDGTAALHISVSAEKSMSEPVTLTVVKNGKVLREESVHLPATIALDDKVSAATGLSYYRVYLRGAYPLQLVSNPLFVE